MFLLPKSNKSGFLSASPANSLIQSTSCLVCSVAPKWLPPIHSLIRMNFLVCSSAHISPLINLLKVFPLLLELDPLSLPWLTESYVAFPQLLLLLVSFYPLNSFWPQDSHACRPLCLVSHLSHPSDTSANVSSMCPVLIALCKAVPPLQRSLYYVTKSVAFKTTGNNLQ